MGGDNKDNKDTIRRLDWGNRIIVLPIPELSHGHCLVILGTMFPRSRQSRVSPLTECCWRGAYFSPPEK